MKKIPKIGGATLLENLIAVCVFTTSLIGILQLQSLAFNDLQQATVITQQSFEIRECIQQIRLLPANKITAACEHNVALLETAPFLIKRYCEGNPPVCSTFIS